jgi:hypothetical protein
MKVDPRIIEPFNEWWRSRNHCEPDLKAIEAFEAGFKAGIKRIVDEVRAVQTSESKP